MTNFQKFLKTTQKPVFAYINKFLPKGTEYSKIVRDYPERKGKYFRPGLLLLCCELFGGNPKAAIPLAAVIQTAEDWLLIHDDVQDAGLERRGKPSLNSLYGNEVAINAADSLHVLMWKMLDHAVRGMESKRAEEIRELVGNVLLATTEGQFLELQWRQGPRPLFEKNYFDIVQKKTAPYTVVGPAVLGALVAGQHKQSEIEHWAIPLAYAFQICDDVLDFQKGGDDLQESKPTLMLVHVWKHASIKELHRLQIILRKPIGSKTKQELSYIVKLIQRYDSMNYAKKLALKLAMKAQKEFEKTSVHLPKKAAELMRQAIEFSASRSF